MVVPKAYADVHKAPPKDRTIESVSWVKTDGVMRIQIHYGPVTDTAPLNVFQRRAAEDDNTSVSSLLAIVPEEELEFCPTEENIISLSNISEKYVAYKVKTTSPKKYCMRPSTGVIQPNGHADINVSLRTVPVTGVTKDTFSIMCMEVGPEVPVSQVNNLFKVISRDKYSEHRLSCRLETVNQRQSRDTESTTEELNKLSQQMEDFPFVKSWQAEVDSVSMVSRLSGTQSELLEVWQEEYDERETLLSSHQRLESQMRQLRKFIFLLVGVILLFLLFLITIFPTYWTENLPVQQVNKYTVNACLPLYLL